MASQSQDINGDSMAISTQDQEHSREQPPKGELPMPLDTKEKQNEKEKAC
jgi:hypothetical protein